MEKEHHENKTEALRQDGIHSMSGYVRYVQKLDTRAASRLGHLDIELTERCNNDCIHCCINLPENDPHARSREMTTARVKDLLAEAAALGCLQVRFTGGEPLIRHDFEDLYLSARRLGLKVRIFTNARLITPHLADLFARIPPLLPIEISVYGMHAESYEAVTRVSGSFAEFRRGLDLLADRKVSFVVKTALLPPNRADQDEFEAWAGTLPSMNQPPGLVLFLDLRNRRDDENKNRLIASLRLTPEQGLAVMARDMETFRKGAAEFAARFMGPPGDRLFRCGAGNGLCIDAYGRAQPCMGVRAPELTMALFPNPIAEESSSGGLRAALNEFKNLKFLKAKNPEYLRRCAVCFLKGLCDQCPAKSWSEHGTLDTPVEYLCRVAHAQARRLGWLGNNERAWTVIDWKDRLIRPAPGS